jgi:hypothetical protein
MKDILNLCINEIANLTNEDKVNIKGKFYTTVDKRLQIFRKHFGTYSRVKTNVILNDLERVVVEASILVKQDGEWIELGNDCAEEFRSMGMVNKTSALENCTTSAIGRALASCGLGGGEYASSFEVDNAINAKPKAPDLKNGFSIRNAKGNVLEFAPDSATYLKHLRNYLGDPEADGSVDMFNQNKEQILKASKDASAKKDVDAYAKLIALYQEDEPTE